MKELLVKQAACTHWSKSTYKEEAESAYHKQECIATTSMARKVSIRSFEAGAEWKAKQSPWISVKDELPDESEWVFIAGGIRGYSVLFYCAGLFYSNIKDGTYDSSVTHWMQIP